MSLATVRGDGSPLYPVDVANSSPLLNATMNYLLTQNASNMIGAMNYSQFGKISLFYNRKVTFNGVDYIMSCETYANADNAVNRQRKKSGELFEKCR